MRVLKFGVVLTLAIVLGAAATVRAEPVNPKQVPADAKWLAHVDVDAMRASTVVQKAWQKCMEMHKDAAKHLEKAREMWGFDLQTDLHGLTFFGKEPGKHTGVLIVYAKLDLKQLSEKAEKAPDHKVVKYGSYNLHSWTHKGPHHAGTVSGTSFAGDRLLLASSVEELKAALDVLDGKSPSLAADSPLAGKLHPGTTLLFRAIGLSTANLPGKCPLAKQMESVRIAVGEQSGQSFFRAKAVMTNAEVVGQVKAIVEGAKALATLHCGSNPQVKKLIDALTVNVNDKTVHLTWSGAAGDVWELLQKHAQRMAEMRAKKAHAAPGSAAPCKKDELKKDAPSSCKKSDAKKDAPAPCKKGDVKKDAPATCPASAAKPQAPAASTPEKKHN